MHKTFLKVPVLKAFLSLCCSWDVLEPLRGGKAYLEDVTSLEVCPEALPEADVESLAYRRMFLLGRKLTKKMIWKLIINCESSTLA